MHYDRNHDRKVSTPKVPSFPTEHPVKSTTVRSAKMSELSGSVAARHLSRAWRIGWRIGAIVALAAVAGDAVALDIRGYTPSRHERFYSGADKDFLGARFDFSGIGTSTPPREEYGFNRSATMISDNFFLSANHLAPKLDVPIRFFHTNAPDSTYEDHVPSWGTRVDGDVWLGRFDEAPSAQIARYPILDLGATVSYEDLEFYLYGLSKWWNTVLPIYQDLAVGRNRIDSFYTSTTYGQQFRFNYSDPSSPDSFGEDEAQSVGGDSGKPSFVAVGDQVVLIGVHTTGTSDAFLPPHIARIQRHLDSWGQEVAVVTQIPEPSSITLVGFLLGGWILTSGGRRRAANTGRKARTSNTC